MTSINLMNPFFCYGIAQLVAGLLGGSAWTLFLIGLIQENGLDLLPGSSLDELGAFAMLVALGWWIVRYFRDWARSLEKQLKEAHERECIVLQEEVTALVRQNTTLQETLNTNLDNLKRRSK